MIDMFVIGVCVCVCVIGGVLCVSMCDRWVCDSYV